MRSNRGGALSRTAAVFLASGSTGLVGCPGSIRGAQNDIPFDEIYAGTVEAPIAGIAFGPQGPVVLYRSSEDVGPQVQWVRVPRAQTVVFPNDWSRYRLVSYDALTSGPDLVSDPARLPFGWDLALGSQSALAWPDEVSPSGEPKALLLGPNGKTPLELPPGQATWGAVAMDGSRAIVGMLAATIVFDPAGGELIRLPAAEFGQLSRSGAWLALAHDLAGRALVSIVRTRDWAATYIDAGEPLALAFDPAETRLAVVAREEVKVYTLAPDGPTARVAIPAPPGQEWRSAAFDAHGRLALGAIRDVIRARRKKREPDKPGNEASAKVVVVVYPADLQSPLGEARVAVKRWNSRSPALAFDPGGHLFAITWPSAYQILVP